MGIYKTHAWAMGKNGEEIGGGIIGHGNIEDTLSILIKRLRDGLEKGSNISITLEDDPYHRNATSTITVESA